MSYKPKDYKSHLKPIWCPGCGDYGVLSSITKAFAKLELEPWNVGVISGIGCSSRLPGYLKTYSFNAVHGRAVPIATGLKLARPKTTVLAVGGDGDGFAIGGNHFPHAARRNVDITYIVMDNSIYGLTKGQTSPTTDLERKTATSPYGNIEPPVWPLSMALAGQATFVAQGLSADLNSLTDIIVAGIKHHGFSFILVKSPCITYGGMAQVKSMQERARPIDESHDPSDKRAAYGLAEITDYDPIGIFYQEKRPTFGERMGVLKKSVRPAEEEEGLQMQVEDILDSFLPQ